MITDLGHENEGLEAWDERKQHQLLSPFLFISQPVAGDSGQEHR